MKNEEAAHETQGVTVELLATLDLGPEIEGMAGRQLRMRMVTMEPGGVFGPVHDHDDRPGLVYILQGTITDHRDGVATEYGPGVGWAEDRHTVHWLENARHDAGGGISWSISSGSSRSGVHEPIGIAGATDDSSKWRRHDVRIVGQTNGRMPPHTHIHLVAARMRQTLIEVLQTARGSAMYSLPWLVDRVEFHLDPRSTSAVLLRWTAAMLPSSAHDCRVESPGRVPASGAVLHHLRRPGSAGPAWPALSSPQAKRGCSPTMCALATNGQGQCQAHPAVRGPRLSDRRKNRGDGATAATLRQGLLSMRSHQKQITHSTAIQTVIADDKAPLTRSTPE
ncbi:MAG: cupin domain-containing protein [Caldilineaceae bacterium]